MVSTVMVVATAATLSNSNLSDDPLSSTEVTMVSAFTVVLFCLLLWGILSHIFEIEHPAYLVLTLAMCSAVSIGVFELVKALL